MIAGRVALRFSMMGITVLSLVAGAFADETLNKLVKTKKYNDAIAYADDKIPTAGRPADVWVKVGISNEEIGLNEKALACFLVASRVDMKSYDAYLGVSRIYNKINQSENALTYAKKALDLQQTGEASWEFARACIALKRPKDAKDALEKVIENDPNNVAACRGLAGIYWDEKAYAKALPLLKTAYATQPNAEDAYKIGSVLFESGKTDSAMFYLKDAITKNPALFDANLQLARAYYIKEKYLAAATEFEKIATKVTLTGDDQYSRAVSQEKTGSPDAALKAYIAAAAAFGSTKSKEAILSNQKAGKAALEKKKYDAAIVYFTAIAAADPQGETVSDVNFLFADAYSGQGNMPKAISYLEKALAIDKNNVEAYARLADLYQKSNMPEKAKQVYEKITTINPNDPKIYLTLGDYNLKAKKFADALKYYEKSFIIEKTAVAASGLAQSAAALDKWEKALDAAESAVRFDPSLVEPRMVLAQGFFRNSQYKEAKEQLDFLVGKKPNEVEYLKQLAYCYKQLNDPVNMAYTDRKIVAIDTGNIESRLRLAKYEFTQRNYKQAQVLYQQLTIMMPENTDVYKSLYEISVNMGDKMSALTYLKKYVALNPNDAVGQKNLGNVLYDQHNTDAALAAYRAAIKLDPKIKGVYKQYVDIVTQKGLKDELQPALAGAIAANEADANMYATLGGIYQRLGQCPKAMDLYQKALTIDPKNVPVLAGYAQCQAAQGNVDGAIVSLEQVVAFNPGAVDEFRQLGELYTKKNRDADAISMYKKYLDKRHDDSHVAGIVGDYMFNQKSYEEACKYFNMLVGQDTKNSTYLLHWGKACNSTKNFRRAIAILSQLAILTPENPEVYFLMYSAASQDSTQLKDAAGFLKKYIELKPADIQSVKLLGDLLFAQKDIDGALAAYRKALAADPTIKGVYKRYFDIATQKGNAADINQALTGAINAGEADAAMYAVQGDNFLKQDACPKAIQMYQKALVVDPKNNAVLISLANCQMKTGSLQDAAITYEQVIAFSPNDSHLYKQLGDCYMAQKKKDAAITVYKKYLDKEPGDVAVAITVGQSAYNAKEFADAVKYLSLVTGDAAKSSGFLTMMAQSYYQTKDNAKAKKMYVQLAALNPQDASLEKILYDLESKEGNKEEALSHLRKYAAINTKDAGAQKDLGDILYDRKDLNGAYAAYKTALAADPTIKGIYKRYAELAGTRGTIDENIAVLSAAVAADEADAGMYSTLGSLYEKKALYPKAIQMYQKSMQLDPRNVNVMIALGSCQLKSGATNDAAVTYEQVLVFNPSDTKIYKMLGDMYLQQQKKDQAVSVYKKYLDKQPGNMALAMLIGQYAYTNKNYDEAATYLGMISGEEAHKTSFITMFANASYQKKDYVRAKELYNDLASQTPLNPDVFKTLYDICQKTNDKDGMINNLRKYAALNPKDAQAQRDIADYLYDQKDMNGAYAAYKNAVTADPGIKGIYKRYAELATTRGTTDEVIAVLTNAGNAGEADAGMYGMLGTLYEKKTFYPKAIACFNKALQMDQRNVPVLSALAHCLLKTGSDNDAIVTYQQVVAMSPEVINEYKILGDLYIKQGKVDQAKDVYNKYLSKVPDDPDVAMFLADDAFKNKDYDNTIKYLAKAEKSKSGDVEFLYMYGRAYYYVKDYKKCADMFERIRAVTQDSKLKNPHLAVMLRMLADSYDKLNDASNALALFTAYTKLPEVKDPEASFRKAQLAEATNPQLAAKYYEENTVAFPSDFRNFYGAGMLYSQQPAMLSKAATLLTKFLSMKDTIPSLWLSLGKIYGQLGNDKQELEMYQQFIQRDASNPEACEEIGVALLNKHKENDAMVFLEMANALHPNDADYMFALSRGYVRINKLTEALPLLEKAEKLKPSDDKIHAMYNFVLQKSEKSNSGTTKNADW